MPEFRSWGDGTIPDDQLRHHHSPGGRVSITCSCGHEYHSQMAPCPEGIEGCLVLHYAKDAHVCPKCGTVPIVVAGEPCRKEARRRADARRLARKVLRG